MKFIIVFAALFAAALAVPLSPIHPARSATTGDVTVLRSESEVGPQSFKYSYETSDGASAKQEGELHNIGAENEAIAVRGSYSFIADDGVTYTVNYVADENGFQPQGAHLPSL